MTIIIWEMHTQMAVGFLEGHKESIQDLLLFENGLLCSCAYDKKIIIWQYEKQEKIDQFERNEEFKCLDYISSTKQLLVGTNDKSILTFNIEHLIGE